LGRLLEQGEYVVYRKITRKESNLILSIGSSIIDVLYVNVLSNNPIFIAINLIFLNQF